MARPRMISLRIEGGWYDKRVPNKTSYHCDTDGSRLHVAPDGKTVFCNQVHMMEKK